MKKTLSLSSEFGHAKKWVGRWIWKKGEESVKNSYYYFRKEFIIKEIPTDSSLYATADSRYLVFINGRFAGRGIPQTQAYYQYYNIHQCSEFLVEGVNTIAFIVNYVGNVPESRGGLLAELACGDDILAATDQGWKVCRAEAWSRNTYYFRMSQYSPYQEVFNRNAVPEGWTLSGFDDSQWEGAEVVKGLQSSNPPAVAPWTYLLPRDIPYMKESNLLPNRIEKIEENLDVMNRMRGEDLSINLSFPGNAVKHSTVENAGSLLMEEGTALVANSTNHFDHVFDGIYAPSILLDFGKIVTAYVSLDLEGVKDGVVDIGYAERLFDGHFNNTIECQLADRYIMKEGRQKFQSFTWKAFRYIKLQFRNCFQKVKIHSVKG